MRRTARRRVVDEALGAAERGGQRRAGVGRLPPPAGATRVLRRRDRARLAVDGRDLPALCGRDLAEGEAPVGIDERIGLDGAGTGVEHEVEVKIGLRVTSSTMTGFRVATAVAHAVGWVLSTVAKKARNGSVKPQCAAIRRVWWSASIS